MDSIELSSPVSASEGCFTPVLEVGDINISLDLGDGSRLMMWPSTITRPDFCPKIKTFIGKAMLEFKNGNWCGFDEIKLDVAPEENFKKIKIPEHWSKVPEASTLEKVVFGPNVPFTVQYPQKHKEFIEARIWPLGEENWKKVEFLGLRIVDVGDL